MNVLNATELYTVTWLILGDVNFTSRFEMPALRNVCEAGEAGGVDGRGEPGQRTRSPEMPTACLARAPFSQNWSDSDAW